MPAQKDCRVVPASCSVMACGWLTAGVSGASQEAALVSGEARIVQGVQLPT